jgi:hypothetical protein
MKRIGPKRIDTWNVLLVEMEDNGITIPAAIFAAAKSVSELCGLRVLPFPTRDQLSEGDRTPACPSEAEYREVLDRLDAREVDLEDLMTGFRPAGLLFLSASASNESYTFHVHELGEWASWLWPKIPRADWSLGEIGESLVQ